MRDVGITLGIVLVWILLVALVCGIAFGVNYLVAWLVVLVAGGFGLTLPFWPVVGAVFLTQLVLGWIGGARK